MTPKWVNGLLSANMFAMKNEQDTNVRFFPTYGILHLCSQKKINSSCFEGHHKCKQVSLSGPHI